jgi:hypothetical protein
VRFWRPEQPLDELSNEVVRGNVLNKTTRARAADILRRTFVPRFIKGPIPNAWKLLRPLEDVGASAQLVKPIYYWVTARAEPMMADFVGEVVWPRVSYGRAPVSQADAVNWLTSSGCSWSPAVSTKVGRGLLAALRDFGILEGRVHKTIASVRLPVGSFAYLSFCLHSSGQSQEISSAILIGGCSCLILPKLSITSWRHISVGCCNITLLEVS